MVENLRKKLKKFGEKADEYAQYAVEWPFNKVYDEMRSNETAQALGSNPSRALRGPNRHRKMAEDIARSRAR